MNQAQLTCKGKVCYTSAFKAHRALETHSRRRKKISGTGWAVYRCPVCHLYHLSGHDGQPSRSISRRSGNAERREDFGSVA